MTDTPTPPLKKTESSDYGHESGILAVTASFGRLVKGYVQHAFNCVAENVTISYINAQINKRSDRITGELADIACHNGNQHGLNIPAYMKSKMVQDAANPATHGNVPSEDIYDQAIKAAAPAFAEANRLGEYAIGLGEFIYELRTHDLSHAPAMLPSCVDAMCDLGDTFMSQKASSAVANNYLHWIGVLHDDKRCSAHEQAVIKRSLPVLREAAIRGGHLGEFQITLAPLHDRYYPAKKPTDAGMNHNK